MISVGKQNIWQERQFSGKNVSPRPYRTEVLLGIRRMIKETDEDRFEDMRCLNQELTFEAAKKEFALREVDFGPQQMRTLKLIDRVKSVSSAAQNIIRMKRHAS